MLEFSKKTNLLEQSIYRYTLQDVEEPNLFRDIFNYEEVPKIAFNHRRVPINMPEDIWITDTSFRDGQQSMAPYTVKQIVDLYTLLSRLSGPYGIIRQSEFFIYTKKDREAILKCMELGLKFPQITTWIRAKKEDFQLVKDLEIKETGILVSCIERRAGAQVSPRRCHESRLLRVCGSFRQRDHGSVGRSRYPRKNKNLRYYGLRSSLSRGSDAPQRSRSGIRSSTLFGSAERNAGVARSQRFL